MGRLLRLLLAAMARGLRAIAGRLTPIEVAPRPAPEAEPVEDHTEGPLDHWLEMVRTRAPGLHVSLQERGLTRSALSPAPSASALQPRERQPHQVQPVPPVALAAPIRTLPMTRPARSSSTDSKGAAISPVSPPTEVKLDLEPHAWESTACTDDQEDWTRVPSRHLAQSSASAERTPILAPEVGRLNATNVATMENWQPPEEASPCVLGAFAPGKLVPPVQLPNDQRHLPTAPDLRPFPVIVPDDSARYTPATPAFAPSRDEDVTLRRPLRAQVKYDTPVPTPWHNEALCAAMAESLAPRFAFMRDEVTLPEVMVPSAIAARAVPPMAYPPVISPRRQDANDFLGAWPTLPAARNPVPRTSSISSPQVLPEVDRWPELPRDEFDEGNDPDLSLPAGHRERLEREQRGQAWNG
jgi:hypothetical protein